MNELNNFFLGVQQVAQDAVDKAPYDRTFRGVIEGINNDDTCNVRINGRTYNNVSCPIGVQINEVVDVLFPQNNPSLMKVVNVLISDYIIERGTSGIWTYRKWTSGDSECWLTDGYISSGVPTSMTANGALYTSNVMTLVLPPNLFVVTPNVSIDVVQGGGMWFKATGGTSKDNITYQMLRTNNTQDSAWLSAQCKGRWK